VVHWLINFGKNLPKFEDYGENGIWRQTLNLSTEKSLLATRYFAIIIVDKLIKKINFFN